MKNLMKFCLWNRVWLLGWHFPLQFPFKFLLPVRKGNSLLLKMNFNQVWPKYSPQKYVLKFPCLEDTMLHNLYLNSWEIYTELDFTNCTGWSFNRVWVDRGFPRSLVGKESACNVGDLGSIPGSGRSLGVGNGNPLQYSCLENSR